MVVTKIAGVTAIAAASALGLVLALSPAVPVSDAQAATVYNFNKPKKPGKRVVRKRVKKKADSPFFFSPACLIPGGGSFVCAVQQLQKKN